VLRVLSVLRVPVLQVPQVLLAFGRYFAPANADWFAASPPAPVELKAVAGEPAEHAP